MKLNIKISTLIFLTCFLFQNAHSQQNMNGWFWTNSQPQGQTLNWAKIVDATHYYAVGEQGVFMKSNDGGDSWIINSDAGVLDPSFSSGATLRLSTGWFFNANSGFVAGQSVSNDGGIIRKTTDGGLTFSDVGLGLSSGLARVNDIYFVNTATGYLCGNSIVKAMKTTDGGLTWNQLPNMPSITGAYNCIYVKDANNILLGTESEGLYRRIVRTTDGGTTWLTETLPGSTIVDIKDIQFQNATTGFVSGNSVAANPPYFAYTINGGATWTEAAFPNKQMGLYQLQIIGSTVYTLGSYNSYYYTSNLGVTWDSVNFSDPSNPYQPYEYLVYSFDINGSDAIVVGLNGKVNVSNDGGSSWRNKNYSVGNSQYTFACVYAQPGTQNVWAGGAGGLILYSSNRGTTWTKQPTTGNYNIYDIDMLNSNTGYAVGGNAFAGEGYCFKTINGGLTWTPLTITQPSYQINGVDFIDVNTGWLVGGLPFNSGSVISKTIDGGLTWTDQTTNPGYFSAFGEVKMANANTGYITSGAFVVKTTNGGNNWNQLTVTPSSNWRIVNIFPNNTVYLGGGQLVNKSTDGGATWSTVSIPSPTDIFHMDWADLNNGLIGGTQGYTAKTSDGGITWKERNTGSSTIYGVSMASRDTCFAVCWINVYGAIFRLYDNVHPVTLNLTVGIEGFWDGVSQVSDTVKCHLRNSASPYNEVEVANAVLNNSGAGTFTFNTLPAGSYYIEITQRNSLETWSGLPVSLAPDGTYNYNFTTAATQAYGNNLILKDGKYCNYSGDVNQDGIIDLTDLTLTFNAASTYVNGYVATDVNGDTVVDLTDLVMAFNNSSSFVQKHTP